MRKLIEITASAKRWKDDKVYYITYATLDDGTEGRGYGLDFKVGDEVEVFYDKKWDQIKFRKTPKKGYNKKAESDRS